MSDSARHGILVIGAGELGGSVLDALIHEDPQAAREGRLSILLRPSSAPRHTRLRDELAARNVSVVEADVATVATTELAALLAPFHTVVSCVGFAAGPGTQTKITAATLQAGVPRYVPWQFGVDYDAIGRHSPQDLFDEQLDVRDLLRAQNTTNWIIVSTGMFTSFVFDPDFGVVDFATSTVNALGSWDNELTLTTAEDIGTLTAHILYAQPPIVDEVVYLAGDTVSFGELADIVERVTGVEVTRNEWTIAHLEDDLKRHPDDGLRKYRAVFAQGVGVAWPREDSYNVRVGIATTGAEEWARQRLDPSRET